MSAMQPVWDFLGRLETYEFWSLWILSGIGSLMLGFIVDYITIQQRALSPYINSIGVFCGVWVGLYLRYNQLRMYLTSFTEPFATLTVVTGATTLLLIVVIFFQARSR